MLYDSELNDAWLLRCCFPDNKNVNALRWREAAAFFGVQVSSVERWFRMDKMPPMARKLCLIKRNGCLTLHDDSWNGFKVVGDTLYTRIPNYTLNANQIDATWYLVNSARKKPRQWWDLALAGFVRD